MHYTLYKTRHVYKKKNDFWRKTSNILYRYIILCILIIRNSVVIFQVTTFYNTITLEAIIFLIYNTDSKCVTWNIWQYVCVINSHYIKKKKHTHKSTCRSFHFACRKMTCIICVWWWHGMLLGVLKCDSQGRAQRTTQYIPIIFFVRFFFFFTKNTRISGEKLKTITYG